MPTNWIDVADSAMKIGLGAAISGIFAFVGLKASQAGEKNRYLLDHKLKVMESASDLAEQYVSELEMFLSRAAGIKKYLTDNDIDALSDKQRGALLGHEKILVSLWPKLRSAISKFKLLKANEAIEALDQLQEIENQLRKHIVFNKSLPSDGEFRTMKDNFLLVSKSYSDGISSLYQSIT